LRNLSQRGVRFFKTSGFYPDFILWMRKGKKTIAFIDPKGIGNSGNFNDEKIQLFKSIKEIESKLDDPMLRLESFILSYSRYSEIMKSFDVGKRPKEEFSANHVRPIIAVFLIHIALLIILGVLPSYFRSS
jgi:hypothetical protein